MNEKQKNMTKTALIVSVAAGAASLTNYLLTKSLVRIAVDRDEPKVFSKGDMVFAGAPIDRDFLTTLASAAERLQKMENEIITLEAQDGVKLTGHFIPAPHPKRVIIAMHGWRTAWYKDFGTISDLWYDNGCSVLYAEQRGQNDSEADSMGFGLTERYDCVRWARWASEEVSSTLPIYLCGVSMGAATVLMAAGLELPENVRGIIADCGFTSPSAIWEHVARNNLHITYGIRSVFADMMFREKNAVGLSEASTIDALRETMIPVLFIHGTDDHFVPVEMTYENYLACASPKRLFIVPGADHGMSHYVAPDQYEKEVLDFWREFN